MRRISVVVLGIVTLLAMGALAIQAQQPAERAPRPGDREALRTKLVELRTEVELLQLDHDAARAGLLKTMEGMEEGDLMGIDVAALMGTAKLELGAISGNAGSLKEMSDLLGQMEEAEGEKPEEVLGNIQKSVKKQSTDFRARLQKKKEEFARKVRTLAGKKLDLDDAERQYREAR